MAKLKKVKPKKARKGKATRESDACHTLQTKLGFAIAGTDIDKILSAQAEHYGILERKLYAAWAKVGGLVTSLKTSFCADHKILARQFNSLAATLAGKVESIRELQKEYLVDAKLRLSSIEEKINELKEEKRIKDSPIGKLWSKKKIANFNATWEKTHISLARAQSKVINCQKKVAKKGLPSICFGSNKDFRKQFNLKQNNFKDLAAWKKTWCDKRSNQIFFLGSHDETQGNSNCQLKLNTDGKSFNLKIKLYENVATKFLGNPNIDRNGCLVLPRVGFSYETKLLISAVTANKTTREALNFRFVKDDNNRVGWRLLVSLDKNSSPIVTHDKKFGCIGIDFNADCMAVVETNSNGDFLKPDWSLIDTVVNKKQELHKKFFSLGHVDGFRVNLDFTKYETTDQREALISDVLQLIVDYAAKVQKPICVEQLDFTEKKKRMMLDTGNTQYHKKKNRGLSSFMYKKYLTLLRSKTRFQGIELIYVNPAYTSVQGLVKYAKQYGISSHIAAAGVIARRGQGFKETLPSKTEIEIPVKGKLWKCVLPARNEHISSNKDQPQEIKTYKFDASKKPKRKKSYWSSFDFTLRKTLSKIYKKHNADKYDANVAKGRAR